MREGGERRKKGGKKEGEGKEEGENNGWNATVTKENGRGELGQKERRESLPGCVTTAMVVHVGREAAHTPSHFSVFSSIPDPTTTSRDTQVSLPDCLFNQNLLPCCLCHRHH